MKNEQALEMVQIWLEVSSRGYELYIKELKEQIQYYQFDLGGRHAEELRKKDEQIKQLEFQLRELINSK